MIHSHRAQILGRIRIASLFDAIAAARRSLDRSTRNRLNCARSIGSLISVRVFDDQALTHQSLVRALEIERLVAIEGIFRTTIRRTVYLHVAVFERLATKFGWELCLVVWA